MIELFIILFTNLSVLILLMIDKNKSNVGIKIFLSFLLGFILSSILSVKLSNYLTKPIDVYRGNTELNVKYTILNNDTISIDSTVIRINK